MHSVDAGTHQNQRRVDGEKRGQYITSDNRGDEAQYGESPHDGNLLRRMIRRRRALLVWAVTARVAATVSQPNQETAA